MKRFATLGLLCSLAACNNGNNNGGQNRNAQRAGSDRSSSADNAMQAGAAMPGRQPTTNPTVVQSVVTDPSLLRSTRLATAMGGPAVGKRDDRLQAVALFYGPLPTGLTFSQEGRLFVCYPRWGMPTNFTVAEIGNGRVNPFPDAQTNMFYPEQPQRADPRTHLVSVQSVVCDSQNRLWLVDSGSINFNPIIIGGPKLWGYDLKTGQRVKEITFGDTLKKNTYLNDVRFDLKRGEQGTAYVTDSGAGGIIVVDLASGQSWRKLDGHPSVMADRNITLMVEGMPLKRRPPTGEEQPVLINSDGIALSPDGRTLYYTPLTGRSIYAVPTDVLADRNASNEQTGAAVRKIADKPSANDGLICDDQGRIYSTDFEDNSIRRLTPSGEGGGGANEARTAGARSGGEVIAQDERLLWPDTFSIYNGRLFVTANQLNRQPDFHGGQNLLQPPFVIFQVPIDGRENPRR